MIKRAALALTLCAGAAQADNAALMDLVASQGCALGPPVAQAVLQAGIPLEDYDALFEQALPTGNQFWRTLPADVCTIRMPDVVSEVSLDDPEVQGMWAAKVSDPEFEEYGCYSTNYSLIEELQRTRGWDADRANIEYVRFLAQHIISGDVRFYSDSPLRTPPGFLLMTGACGDIQTAAALKESHETLTTYFGAFIREAAPNVPCTNGQPLPFDAAEVFDELSGGRNKNAWLGFEAQIIAMGAGWYQGLSATDRGTPRPPLCTYQ